MFRKLFITASIVFVLSAQAAFSAVTININSGNPKLPFPQFLDYKVSKSLASNLPDGVSHAEMEMWMRDAYKIHTNEFSYSGTVTYQNAAGANVTVNLIKDSSSPYCSEGHGYALLGAALMCDKDTFDGLWFYLVENGYFSNTKKYSDGSMWPVYSWGRHVPAWSAPGSGTGDSATDGDDDIALAALIAWKQWGDNTGYYATGGSGANNTAGRPAIQYKQMALDMLRFMVEKYVDGNAKYLSGDIGYDGYMKAGNTWGEVTNWYTGPDPLEKAGPQTTYVDYAAPAYYRCFGNVLQAEGDPAWNYNQYFRATASMNWVVGKLAASTHKVIDAGWYSVNGSNVTFTNYNVGGEDFRLPMRTILDYLWVGNPAEDWDPVTHAVVAGSNTWEYNAAIKQANFLRNPQAQGVACKSYGSSPITYNGVAALTAYNLDGSEYWTFHLNRFGASAAAIVASQDFDLMGQFFRELCIEWDVTTPGDNYITSVPAYFHGFFRQIGLMVLTGNWQSACDIMPTANMKIYKSTDKTYGFPGDTVTYWLNYRNYGSMTAANVYIRDTLPSCMEFVSSTPAPSSSNAATGVYEWGGFSVTGLQNQNYGVTMGGITVVARVKSNAAQGRYCNFADIRCSNGTGWTSSEFPNEISTVLRRNCIDIVSAALTITKTASVASVQVGDTVTYTIDFCNSAAAAGWINGGRSGVNWAGGVKQVPGASAQELFLNIAAHHEAAEPVIDWSNYRVSYFLNSPYHGTAWGLGINTVAPFNATINLTTEDFVACMPTACTDATGKYWNQRLMFNFSQMRTAPTHHLYNFYGMMGRIHMGDLTSPFYFQTRVYLQSPMYGSQDFTDDWSQQSAAVISSQPSEMLFPINPDWTKGDGTSVTWNKVNKHACQTTAVSINNILVEEWDGYTWRRVFGNGPMPGREVQGVHVIDSLPAYLNFGGVISQPAGATFAQAGKSLDWTIGNMQINQCGQIKYYAIVANPGCPVAPVYQKNIAFVYGTKEAPVADDAAVTINCGFVPTNTVTRTSTQTMTATSTSTRTNTATASPTSSASPSPSSSSTPSVSNTPSATFSATPSRTSTQTATPSLTYTASATQSATATNTQTVTPSATITGTFTQIIVSATITQTWTASYTPSNTQTMTPSVTQSSTSSPANTATSTQTITTTHTNTPQFTFTVTPTDSPTRTNTPTNTQSSTPSVTVTITFTSTLTLTATNSPVYTPTNTRTITETATPTRTVTDSPTSTATRTNTPTFTQSSTATVSPSSSATSTITFTVTVTATRTATPTATPSATLTSTPGPTPVEMQIQLDAYGENPRVGAVVSYRITALNPEQRNATGVIIKMELQDGLALEDCDFALKPTVTGNILTWDLTNDPSTGLALTVGPGGITDRIIIDFSVKINRTTSDGSPYLTRASVEYNDPAYPESGGVKHPPVYSEVSYYPVGKPVVFPNPFFKNKSKFGMVRFENIVPGSVVQIFSLSGERIISLQVNKTKVFWDCKNSAGRSVSPGIYFFVINNQHTKEIKKGKLFIADNK